jgi:hypothetical protein
MAFRRSSTLILVLALGASCLAGDPKTFKLEHPAALAGDAFSVEQKTSFVLSTKGGPEKGHIETSSSYKVKVLSKEGAKVVTRFEIDPQTTTSDMSGKAEKSVEPGRTLEATLDAAELSLLPAPTGVKMASNEGLGALASKDAVTVGQTWRAERAVPVASGFAVPVEVTYTVASAEKGPRGEDLVRIVMKSQGSADFKSSGIRLSVAGEGSALFDPKRADRPLEVHIAYRFSTSGGEGADSETRTETTITTHELASGSQEKSK